MHRVLFVCSGNTCRSPMAVGIFNKLVGAKKVRNLTAESAGTMAASGMKASQLAVSVARRHGISLHRHRSRPITKELAERAALILTMTGHQWYDVTEFVPRGRASLLTRFGRPDGEGDDIPDPAGGDEEEYERVFDQLEQMITRSFSAVLEWMQTEAAPKAHGGRAR